MGGEVGHPQGFGEAAQVGEQLQPSGKLLEPPVGLLRQARRDEGFQLTLIVEDGEAAPAGPGQQARPVHHPLQDGVQVQVLGDAQAGLAQAGEALSQGFDFQVTLVCRVQAFTSP